MLVNHTVRSRKEEERLRFLFSVLACSPADDIIQSTMQHSAYRIIDANFNRCREALRVMEDFCRFALNCKLLTQRAKTLRHQLSKTIEKLNTGKLISSRDVPGDVGINDSVKQFARNNLKDCATFAAKRAAEALRTLAETTQLLNSSVAKAMEELRYKVYTLEKDIILFTVEVERFKKVKLYVIISSELPTDVIRLAYQVAAGGADCIQLRAKAIPDDRLLAMATEFVQICKDAGVISIINDRVDIAALAGADGVHLGQNDLSVQQARKLQLTPLIIGKSTHSLKELRTASAQLPTYVSIGPVFATKTKPTLKAVGLEYVKQAINELADTGIYSVAIGGITPDNIEQVLTAGAQAVAVCSVVGQAADPATVTKQLKQKIDAFRQVS